MKKDGQWGFVDPKGTVVIALQYKDAFFFKDGIARVTDGTKNFYIDKNNKWVKDEEKHEEEWEKVGQVPNVVFVEGMVKKGNRYLFYYGAADKYVGVAEASVN